MPTPTKGPRLGGSPSHERIILANLASQLFEHGKITTTEAKAKRLRPLAEKLITKAKRGDLHARRTVMSTIRDKGVVHVLFTEIAPTFSERDGGYLRITKVGPRKGDNAPMAQIELVTESVADSKKANGKAAPAKKAPATKAAPAAAAPAAEEPAAETAPESAPETAPEGVVTDVAAEDSSSEPAGSSTTDESTAEEPTAGDAEPVAETSGEDSADKA